MIISNIKQQLNFMNFSSLTMQKFCSPIFPSFQDLLSHQLLTGTSILKYFEVNLMLG